MARNGSGIAGLVQCVKHDQTRVSPSSRERRYIVFSEPEESGGGIATVGIEIDARRCHWCLAVYCSVNEESSEVGRDKSMAAKSEDESAWLW